MFFSYVTHSDAQCRKMAGFISGKVSDHQSNSEKSLDDVGESTGSRPSPIEVGVEEKAGGGVKVVKIVEKEGGGVQSVASGKSVVNITFHIG